jgi:BirA family biotin operon repressor/biotin-[acetyl-CoA-carboxylase] ligase
MDNLENIGKMIYPDFRFIYQVETDSTNHFARQLAEKGYPEGTLVMADRQTAGKGRKGRCWFSLSGKSLTYSLLLRPEEKAPDQCGQLALMVGLAIAQALEAIGFAPQLKWPNDVLINGKKVAGILLESSIDSGRIHWVVIGIGINLNLEREDFPYEFRNQATSLLIEGKQPVLPGFIVGRFLEKLSDWYFPWKEGRSSLRFFREYEKRSALLGKVVIMEGSDQTIQGRAQRIDETGALWVVTDQGERNFSWGECSLVIESQSPKRENLKESM